MQLFYFPTFLPSYLLPTSRFPPICKICYANPVNKLPKTLSQLGELPFIARIRNLTATSPDVVVGIGDDCAVVRLSNDADEDLVLKSDPVIAGRHFLADTPPEHVGHKAIGRVLSDIAAMGARPRWILVNLVAPGETPIPYIDAIYKGLSALAERHGCIVVGGDTSKGEVFELHVFGCGTLPRGTARLRSGARANDALRVTGRLGGSLPSGAHLTFEPRIREGEWLRERVNAMIDISDGLASELWHVAEESNARLILDANAVPLSDAAKATKSPLSHALADGEDFELLFSVPPEAEATFDTDWQAAFPNLPCTRIGHVETAQTPEVRFSNGTPVPRRGFDHFNKQSLNASE